MNSRLDVPSGSAFDSDLPQMFLTAKCVVLTDFMELVS